MINKQKKYYILIVIQLFICINYYVGRVESSSIKSAAAKINIPSKFESLNHLLSIDQQYKGEDISDFIDVDFLSHLELGSSSAASSSGDIWTEECNNTNFIFNNTQSHCGITDCYSQWQQGTCSQDSNQTWSCVCNPIYYGSDCSYNYNPDYNWDHMDCHTGRFCPPLYGVSLRYCVCPPGYTGLECNVCQADDVCQTINSTYTCDNSVYINENKVYSCVVTSPEVNEDLNNSTATASIDCNFPSSNYTSGEGSCSMDLYYRIRGDPLYFNCTFTNCTRSILPGQDQLISCTQSACNCTTYCGFFLEAIINQVNGWSEFECSSNHDCTFKQQTLGALLPTIPLACVTGECEYTAPTIYPVPIQYTRMLYWYISSGVGVVGVSLALAIISYIYVKQEERKKPVDEIHISCEIRFNDVSCNVTERRLFSSPKSTQILNSISGVCYPGQLTALMGLSGSGKTSLLDILSGRKNVGAITGEVLVNGHPRRKNFKRISGYVTQEDIMIGTLTCREHLQYTAMLKMPEGMPKSQKMDRVNSVLAELNLLHVADNRIGTPEKRGISGGERRRLSIAAELLIDPSILFLDEPTSGLDSHSASELIYSLKQLAKNRNRTIIFSIHQPSAEIFEQFDNLILLHKGRPYYSGKASESVQFFVEQRPKESNEEHQKFLMRVNPADFIISAVNDITIKPSYLQNYYPKHSYNQPPAKQQKNKEDQDEEVEGEDGQIKNVGEEEQDPLLELTSPVLEDNKMLNVEEYATSFWTQFFVVSHRSLLNYFRNPFLLRTTYFVHITVGLILGYLFWKLPNNLEPGAQNRFGSMFFMIALLSFGSITSLDLFYNDRIIFIRERANGYYRTSSYFLAKVITDLIPMRVIPPIILGSICYFMIGFRSGATHFIYFLIALVLTSSTASSMCMAISTISPTFGTANMLSILLLFVFLLFDGFLLARQSIPKYLVWLVWMSFMSYGLEIPVVNEFDGLWIFYNPPNTQGTYADGLEFLQTIGADPKRLFLDMYVLIGMICGYLFLAYIFLRFFVREYR